MKIHTVARRPAGGLAVHGAHSQESEAIPSNRLEMLYKTGLGITSQQAFSVFREAFLPPAGRHAFVWERAGKPTSPARRLGPGLSTASLPHVTRVNEGLPRMGSGRPVGGGHAARRIPENAEEPLAGPQRGTEGRSGLRETGLRCPGPPRSRRTA